ncbi:MAG: hypothetical protein II495_05560, partial [Paludibacteraceae bacterium]|nr:hypothetical protein [Paludibacteraceae bacterium]
MLGTSSILYELVQFVYHYVLCMICVCMSILIIRMQEKEKTTKVVLLFIAMFVITANIFLLHDAILIKASSFLASDEKINDWMLRTNKFKDYLPLYKRCIILVIHSATFCALIF